MKHLEEENKSPVANEQHDDPGVLWVNIPESFSGIEALSFGHKFDAMYQEKQQAETIYIDFSSTKYIDSCAIGSLVHIVKFIKSKDINFKTIGVNQEVYSALEITGLIDMVNLSKEQIN